jgi:hypothetical protein
MLAATRLANLILRPKTHGRALVQWRNCLSNPSSEYSWGTGRGVARVGTYRCAQCCGLRRGDGGGCRLGLSTIPISVVLDYIINGIPIRSWGAAWLDWDPLGTPTGTEERISACGHPYYGTEEHIGMAIPTNSDSKAEGLALLRLEHNRRAMNEYYIV